MIAMSLTEAARIMSGSIPPSSGDLAQFVGVSIDTRTLKKGNLFFAIRGESLDGHDFLVQAESAGASGFVVHNATISATIPVRQTIHVQDTHAALIDLAKEYRRRTGARIVGITGSNGKTTTKEFTAQLLALVEPSLFASSGNLNNLYGMPLSLLAMPEVVKLAVMEMGISRPGEMRQLASIVTPDIAVVTNAGAAHLEFLGTIERVAHEKLSMITTSSPEAPLIVNGDDPRLRRLAPEYHRAPITYGLSSGLMYAPEKISPRDDGTSDVTIEGNRFHVPFLGTHMISNLVCAYAIARTLGYSFDGVDTSRLRLSTAPMRGESIMLDGVRFIVDCYNANPESMRLGLDAFSRIPGTGRRLLILGDMRELGDESGHFHGVVLEQALSLAPALLILVGPHFGDAAARAGGRTGRTTIVTCETSSDCSEQVRSLILDGDIVYLKGSRGVRLELVLEPFRATKGGN